MSRPMRERFQEKSRRTRERTSAARAHEKHARSEPVPEPKKPPRPPEPKRARPKPNKRLVESAEPKSGRCAIVGRANVGKSTLLNALLGQKLAIATSKPQTTRSALLGMYVSARPPLQIAFVDTPGLHRPHNALGRALNETARGELPAADVVVLVTTPGKHAELSEVLGKPERELLSGLGGKQVVLAINKVDQLKQKHKLLPVLAQCMEAFPFAAIVPCSALRQDNLEAIVDELGKLLPEGLAYDPQLLTDKPERFFAAELIREAVIDRTREEVPHGVAVVIDEFIDQPKVTRISATIVVDKDAHKGIVIGKGGSLLKEIGTTAREGMEAMFERKVYLELWVKVVAGWTQSAHQVRELIASLETGRS